MTTRGDGRWTGYLNTGVSTDPDRVPAPTAVELAAIHRRALDNPAARRLRDEVRSNEPRVRIVLSSARRYQARTHGTLTGGITLCGKDLTRPELDPPGRPVVECGKCLGIMEAEDLEYG
jgi:hypothetical protein